MATQPSTTAKPGIVPTPAAKVPANQLCSTAGKVGHAPGGQVTGFSGGGMIPGKI